MIYISIGSNLGNRLNNVQKAVSLLKERYFSDLKMSIVLETLAIVPSNASTEWDRPFLNMVVQGSSAISPEKLLAGLKAIEQEIGRPAVYPKWGPRLIDLDILLWDNLTVISPQLVIPHPELLKRSFLIHLIALLNPECRYQSSQENLYNNKTFGEIAYLTSNINACYEHSFVINPKLVGVVNITPDSFSDGGLNFNPENAIARSKALITEGATVVELGSQSTRPAAVMLDSDMEYIRLQPVLEGLSDRLKNKEVIISIDTFLPQTILNILKDYPVSWINDVKGDLDEKTLKKISEKNLKLVIMHSLTIPPRADQCLDFETTAIMHVAQWAKQKIGRLEKCGFSKDNIIIDPGIGFGKTAYQNILLLKHMYQFKELGCEILVGHSRKSYISTFFNSTAKERDLETIAISQALVSQNVDYLRVHNVQEHQRFFVAQQISQQTEI
jgi:2-amino-4-hydroxy-6-hydroxymethyldihydropteridine diphosphokinase/dihydropteroate synthase